MVALEDRGPLQALRHLAAARSGALLASPERYDGIVRDVRSLVVQPLPLAGGMSVTQPANLDGLAMSTIGSIHYAVSDRIQLILGPDLPARHGPA